MVPSVPQPVRVVIALCAVLPLLAWARTTPVAAHDLPTDVTVQLFVKPEGRQLRLLIRVPLQAMGDVDYPTRGPGGPLDLARIDRALQDAVQLWLIPNIRAFEDDRSLGAPRLTTVRLSLLPDRSFADYETARSHLAGQLTPDATVEWNQAWLDAALAFDVQSDQSSFAIEPAFARLGVRVVTVLRFLPPGRAIRAFEFRGDAGLVRLDPRWHQAALRFVRLGFQHILGGADHLLFLICLAVPVRRFRTLAVVVTAFAVAHSITLAAAALGLAPTALWFPPLIETLIAVSIVYMAIENVLAPRFSHRWVLAFGFGLVHGFGFAFALRESLQFAGSHLVTSLLAFNLGVELGQLLVLLVIIPAFNWLCRRAMSERVAVIVLSVLVAHEAWHWMVERGGALAQFRFAWPALDAALAVRMTEWGLLMVVAAGALWGLGRLSARLRAPDPPVEPSATSRR